MYEIGSKVKIFRGRATNHIMFSSPDKSSHCFAEGFIGIVVAIEESDIVGDHQPFLVKVETVTQWISAEELEPA